MALLVTGLVLTLWLSTAAAADSYRLQDARSAARALSEQSEQLRREVTAMDAAPALAQRAAELGMVPVQDSARLVVAPDGTVTVAGTPKAAIATAPPAAAARRPERCGGDRGPNGTPTTRRTAPTRGHAAADAAVRTRRAPTTPAGTPDRQPGREPGRDGPRDPDRGGDRDGGTARGATTATERRPHRRGDRPRRRPERRRAGPRRHTKARHRPSERNRRRNALMTTAPPRPRVRVAVRSVPPRRGDPRPGAGPPRPQAGGCGSAACCSSRRSASRP